MCFTCLLMCDRASEAIFWFFPSSPTTNFLISFLWTLWKCDADAFNGPRRCLSLDFNGIISHRPAIKSIFNAPRSITIFTLWSHSIIRNPSKTDWKKIIASLNGHFFHHHWQAMPNGQSSFIDTEPAHKQSSDFYYFFFNHFPIRVVKSSFLPLFKGFFCELSRMNYFKPNEK